MPEISTRIVVTTKDSSGKVTLLASDLDNVSPKSANSSEAYFSELISNHENRQWEFIENTLH